MLRERIEARHEVRAVDDARRFGELDELPRLGCSQRQRLLADDVLAGRQRLLNLPVVEVVRRGLVHDVDVLVLEQLSEVPVHVA
jgi:hypothetical protein